MTSDSKREEFVQTVRRACAFCNYKWPEQLTGGVMFFEGCRITIEEFNKQARLFKRGKK